MRTYYSEHYYFGVGRRKTSTSRVYLKIGSGKITINGLSISEYFYGKPSFEQLISKPLKVVNKESIYDIVANVKGGGFTGQAESTRLAISRALLSLDKDFKLPLKSFSLLTRDPRSKERKKCGHKKARKSPQFSKR